MGALKNHFHDELVSRAPSPAREPALPSLNFPGSAGASFREQQLAAIVSALECAAALDVDDISHAAFTIARHRARFLLEAVDASF